MEIVKDDIVQEQENITTESTVESIPQYDPNKKYIWGVDTNFVLNGGQFGLILNSLRTIVSSEEAIKILMADKACQEIEKIMAENVASGNIKEAQ